MQVSRSPKLARRPASSSGIANNGSRECAPDDRLREIQLADGKLDCFVAYAPRNDGEVNVGRMNGKMFYTRSIRPSATGAERLQQVLVELAVHRFIIAKRLGVRDGLR